MATFRKTATVNASPARSRLNGFAGFTRVRSDHLGTIRSLNRLGVLHVNQGEYKKAEPLYERLLGFCEKTLGQDHSSTAEILDELAALYGRQGEYTKAEPLLGRALATQKMPLARITQIQWRRGHI